jgi:hypothetical protein
VGRQVENGYMGAHSRRGGHVVADDPIAALDPLQSIVLTKLLRSNANLDVGSSSFSAN